MSNRICPGTPRTPLLAVAVLLAFTVSSWRTDALQSRAPEPAPAVVSALRLYVLNCGQIKGLNPQSFGFKPGELAHPDAAVPCHLIVHPKGTMIWDTGIVPDEDIGTSAAGDRAGRPLRTQLAELGYKPEDITYLALSHYHVDHAANANMFKASTWLVRQAERDAMFAATPPAVANPKHYAELKTSKTVILAKDEYDVFGDGQVVIKAAVGHTPGHQVLILRLKRTGPVMLAGDLYHFPEERHTDRVPTFEFDKAQTLKSRAMIEDYVKRTGMQFWIEHDWVANSQLKKAPQFYD
jgi:glyoxylase-like metal-dependent hydrolase (beta-lactamase superfamily II)